MRVIYIVLSYFILIFSPIIIVYRILKKKENLLRIFERYSFASKKRKIGKLIWFHCSSVGELLSLVPLIEKFEYNKDINQILITTNTLSSSKIFEQLDFKKTIHQFFPIDNDLIIDKFIKYWKPSALFLCESEVWPNLIEKLKKNKIRLILINGRMTLKSFKKWKKFKTFSNEIFRSFDLCLTQNKETQRRLKILGAKKNLYLGNLKFTTSKKFMSDTLDKKIVNFFNKKKILITAASTHFDEESFIFQNHLIFKKKKLKNLISIIIPRHAERAFEIKNKAEQFGFNVTLHSSKEKLNSKTDIYLVDTYGEVSKFYKISNIVFIGGSLIDHGGQNPLEPAKFGCKIIHGPFISNFKEIFQKLKFMGITSEFKSYETGIKIIEKKIKKNSKSFKNNKIIKYGKKVLDLNYAQLKKFI